jgi:hypothetical protein
MGITPFKMRGFSGFGNSPLKKEYSLSDPAPTDKEVSSRATSKKSYSKSKSTSTLQDYASDISGFQSNLTKKHTFYKDKKITLKGQVNMPKGSLSWNPKGNMTKYGNPKVSFSNSANISGKYKIGKNTTLSGSVNFASGKSPQYSAGLKIKF